MGMKLILAISKICTSVTISIQSLFYAKIHDFDIFPGTDQPTRRAFIISIVIKVTQQFDGYLIILIYAGFVFKQASSSIGLELTPNKQVMLIGLVQLLGSTVATCIVEKTGRKARFFFYF